MDESTELAVETLRELKTAKEAEILRNQNHIQSLEDVNSTLQAQARTLEEAIQQVLKAYGGIAVSTSQSPALLGKYEKMRLTEAIFDIVSIHGIPPGLLVPEIIEKLETEGFKSNAKKLYASVYATAQSLVEQGKIREGKRGTKRSFIRKL